jgi:hypothetical protein
MIQWINFRFVCNRISPGLASVIRQSTVRSDSVSRWKIQFARQSAGQDLCPSSLAQRNATTLMPVNASGESDVRSMATRISSSSRDRRGEGNQSCFLRCFSIGVSRCARTSSIRAGSERKRLQASQVVAHRKRAPFRSLNASPQTRQGYSACNDLQRAEFRKFPAKQLPGSTIVKKR